MSINMLPKKLTMSHIRYVVKRFFVKKKYRDELFRYIFSNKKVLLELYNAINNSDYHDEMHIPQELRIRSGGTERHSASN